MSRLQKWIPWILPLLLLFVLTGCDDDMTGGMEEETTAFTVTIENTARPFPIVKSGAFNTPEGAGEAGPLGPGETYAIELSAGPNAVPGTGMKFSFATMFIASNDLFYAFEPGGLSLYDEGSDPDTERDDTPIGQNGPVDVTDQVALWDAGTEVNETPGAGPNQPMRQSGPDTGPEDDNDLISIEDDSTGAAGRYPATEDVIRVTVENTGEAQFVVRITNVTDESGAQASGNPILLSPGTFAAHFDQTPQGTDVTFPGMTPGEQASEGIERIAEDGSPSTHADALGELTGTTVPLSPGAFAVHGDGVQLYSVGEPASEGVERIAEDGQPSTLESALSGTDGVNASGAFGDGPIAPRPPDQDDAAFTFSFDAEPGDRLSLLTMYIQSNDLFYGFAPEGLSLFDESGAPIRGPQTVRLYDAGTEVDEEPGVGRNQAPRQPGPNTGADEDGPVAEVTNADGDPALEDGDYEYLPTEDVIRITVTPQQ